MKAKNIPEFIALIKRYESITIEEIESHTKYYFGSAANRLTGFGNINTCSLCIKVKNECENCVYQQDYGCFRNKELNESYNLIEDAEDANELLDAYLNRAMVLRQYAKKNNIEIP